MAVVAYPPRPAGKESVPVAPSLNCKDLPEVSAWSCAKWSRKTSADRHARSKNSIRGSKSRMRPDGLPVLSEMDECSDSDDALSPETPRPEWSCHLCTFTNNGLLRCCEMCGAAHDPTRHTGKTGGSEEAVEATFTRVEAPHDDWPALPAQDDVESWVDCDVSSVASSWLDVGDASEHVDNVDGVVVSAGQLAPRPPSAPLWSSIVGTKVAEGPTPLAAGTLMPALTKRPKKDPCRVPRAVQEEEEDRDTNLDELEARRMHGTPIGRHGPKSWRKKR